MSSAPAALAVSRRAALFLLAVGAWTWLIWPRFLLAVWRDERSFDGGPTSFLLVHLVLIVTSLAVGTATALIGWRALRGARRAGASGADARPTAGRH